MSHQVSVELVDDPGIDNSHMAIAISKGMTPWKVGRSETLPGDDNARRRCREFLKGGEQRLLPSLNMLPNASMTFERLANELVFVSENRFPF